MTPLETYLSSRPQSASPWNPLHARLSPVAPALGRWLDRRMWPENLRHMRSFAPGYTYQREDDGTWTMLWKGKPLTRSVPVAQVTARIESPVTIVASGPSSKEADWERIKQQGRFVIAVNGATTVLKGQGIRPDLHVIMDRHFAMSGDVHIHNSLEVPLVATHRAASVVAARTPGIFARKRLALVERVNAWYGRETLPLEEVKRLSAESGCPFEFPVQEDRKCTIGWSRDLRVGIFSGCTVVVSALQVAVTLGATDIEIIGMDLSNQGRAYDEGSTAQPSFLQKQYAAFILPTFEVMSRTLKGSGVKVRNLSPVCPIPASIFDL